MKKTKKVTGINRGIRVADLALSQDRQHATSTHCRERDLTSRPLHGSGFDRLPLQSSSMSFPSRIDNTSSSKMSVCEDTPSSRKAFGAVNVGRKKSWKRCVAHVYISRLIQVLQQGKDTEPSDSIQLRPSQQSSTGEAVINRDDRNQSNNFLSLSTGAGPEVKSGLNRLGITLETKGQELHLHSVAHRNNYMPNSMPQNRFPSVSYRDQVGVSAPPSSMPPQLQPLHWFLFDWRRRLQEWSD